MITHLLRPRASRAALLLAALVTAAAVQACSDVKDTLLEVTDPDLVFPDQLDTPEGATGLRIGALQRWRFSTGGDNTNGQESTWLTGGLLADEWGTSSTFVENDQLDERRIKTDNNTVTFDFRKLNRVRTAVDQALPAMKKWRPTETTNIAELYLARGFVEMQLASDFCNGIPLSDATKTPIAWGDPLRVSEVFAVSIVTLDSGIALVANTADSTSDVARALKITKARSLLGLGGDANYAAAAVLVAGIPTNFTYNHTYLASSGSNAIWGQARSGRRYNVGDSLEGNSREFLVKNSIPFFSSKDPRVPSAYTVSTNGKDTTKSQDGKTFSRTTTIWGQETSVSVASGIDARLIEAEAALKSNYATPTTGTLAILNGLRSAARTIGSITTPVMTPLTDPGTQTAREDQLFREKAFWTFSRGQRLGDMRRLIRQYGRAANTVFPEGAHYRGGTYGPDVNLPVPKDEELNNPKFSGCLDRAA